LTLLKFFFFRISASIGRNSTSQMKSMIHYPTQKTHCSISTRKNRGTSQKMTSSRY